MPDDLEDALDRLYGLPAAQFIAARDALARELRGSGRRAQADEVRSRRRPTAPAAAINQLGRIAADRVDALLEASRRLREVQERLLAGDAGRDELRAAAGAERRAVAALLAAAHELPEAPSPAALEKVRETLQAAATDEVVRDAIASGRLEREAQPSGAWGGLPLQAAAEDEPAAEPARDRRAGNRAAELGSARDRRADRRAAELERARAAAADALRGLQEAKRSAAEARDALDAAALQAEHARADLVRAGKAEAAARDDAQRSLRALKRAEAVAAEMAEKLARLEPDPD